MDHDLTRYLPKALGELANPQTDLPRIAKSLELKSAIEQSVRDIPRRFVVRPCRSLALDVSHLGHPGRPR